jgi:phenylalanyl-tRNA synthetase beta subunit
LVLQQCQRIVRERFYDLEAAQVLRPHGYGALISADTKALIHATGNLNWRDVPSRGIQRIGMGGLNAQMIVMNKLDPCCKDLSVWMEADSPNLAAELLARALERLSTFYVNDMQELQENRSGRLVHGTALVNDVKLIDTYFHAQSCRLSHGYRITLDGQLTNGQAKQLEKVIRQSIEDNLLPGMISLR